MTAISVRRRKPHSARKILAKIAVLALLSGLVFAKENKGAAAYKTHETADSSAHP